MILLIENNMQGGQHRSINRAMASVFKKLFRCSELAAVCTREHYDQCLESLGFWSYFCSITAYGPENKFKKYFFELVSFFRIFKMLRDDKIESIIFLSLSPVSHFLFRFFSYFGLFKVDVFVVFHGELVFLKEKSFKPWEPGFWMRMAFKIRSVGDGVRYIVLGGHIDVPAEINFVNLVKINHPVVFEETGNGGFSGDGFNLKVGLLGCAAIRKGSEQFFIMSDRLKPYSNLSFYVTGSIEPALSKYTNVFGDFSGNFVKSDLVQSMLRRLDCAVFVYDSSYDFVASGALLDAVEYGIPVLCLSNKLFDYLYDQGLRFFEMFNSIDELIGYFESGDFRNLEDMRSKFEEARDFFSVDSSVSKLSRWVAIQ